MGTTDDGTTAGDGESHRGHDHSTDADLACRVAELEATVARLTEALERSTATSPPPFDPARQGVDRVAPSPGPVREPSRTAAPCAHPPDEPPTADATPGVDRRRLLTRAGTAAVGAVLGGAAASVAAASPVAAATGSFDSSSQGTPALTASNTAGGTAVSASSNGGTTVAITATEGFSTPTALGIATAGRGIHVTSSNPSPALDIEHDGEGIASLVVNAPGVSEAIYAVGKFFGVLGTADSPGGFGVSGGSDGGIAGVSGMGRSGAAGAAFASLGGIGLLLAGTSAQLSLRGDPTVVMPPPRSRDDEHGAGEVYLDDQESLWLCVADGTPGTWVRLGGAGTSGAFTVLPNPVRVYDSRIDAPPTDVGPKSPLLAATPRSIDLTRSSSGVPVDATAAVVTATVTNTTGGSPTGPAFLALYRDGTPWPGTSTLNWTAPGTTIASTTVVGLGPGAKIAAYAASRTDVVIDVVGYYR